MSAQPKQTAEKGNWRTDEFASREVAQFWGWLIIPAIALLAALVLPTVSWFKRQAKSEVIIYAAQDQVYAEPILRDFEQETGIKVKAVYDSEAVKTVGLANRLLAERSHPQCDVFWGNEEMRTRQLASQNVFRETNGWAAFGYRSRRVVINTNYVSERRSPTRLEGNTQQRAGSGIGAPTSLLELTNGIWRGKVALAFPQFGTTATHFHVLKQLWGEAAWLAWCRALAANRPFIVDGNSVVVKLVGRGEAWIGLTDSDDVFAGQREGLPIAVLPLTPPLSPSDGERVAENRLRGETLLIPNTIAVIRDAPHPANAQRLFEYLQRREVAEKLVQASALESADISEGRPTRVPESTAVSVVRDSQSSSLRERTLNPGWETLLRELETTTMQLNEIFLR